MNTLQLLKEKMSKINNEEYLNKLNYIIIHITRAEKYFELGRENGDINYYNDVLYRTNQAYEGCLKCAYEILLNKDFSNKTTSQVEEELLSNNILNIRVKKLFSIYRNDWRNTSTHQYNFTVDQSEALIAINNVSSFIYLLLDQIKEKDNYLTAQNKLENIKKLPFKQFVTESLVLFSDFLNEKISTSLEEIIITENVLIEELINYFQKLDSKIKIEREVKGTNLRIDLCLTKGKISSLIEVKILKNIFALKNTIGYCREFCFQEGATSLNLFVWEGFGEYKIKNNNHEDITINIIKKEN